MTREEAIDIIKCLAWHTRPNEEEIEQAIKALKQEPCGDAISREDVIKAVDRHTFDTDDGLCLDEDISIVLENLPPVKPVACIAKVNFSKEDMQEIVDKKIKEITVKPRWIPCSERLPEEYEAVIASAKYGVYPEARYSKEYGWEWAYESSADYWEDLENVTAWMPLPEPYRKEGE